MQNPVQEPVNFPIHLIPLIGDYVSTGLFLQLLQAVEALDLGLKPVCINDNGDTAVHLIAAAGKDDQIKNLLEHDVNCTAANSDGYTPLHEAADYGHEKVVQQLLRGGADVSATEPRWTHRIA